MYIDFDSASTLSEAVSWVFNPDKDLVASCALRHVLLKQVSDDFCSATSYASGDTWFYRLFPSQGIIGTEFLIDADDLLSRINNKDGFKHTSLRLSSTKKAKVNAEAITRIVDGKVESAGNILIPTYTGDLSEFESELPDIDWHFFSNIDDLFSYQRLCRIISRFSGLKPSMLFQPVWFRFHDNKLSVTSTEKGGDRGNSMIDYSLYCFSDNLRFGIMGGYLLKSSQVSSHGNINIYLDNPLDPSKVKFQGDLGYAILPVVNDFQCEALSLGSMGFFYHENLLVDSFCKRTFNLPQVQKGLAIQVSKVGSTRNDRLLELIDEQLVITKRSDVEKQELSSIPTWTSQGSGDWLPLIVDHEYLSTSLSVLDLFISQEIKHFTKQVQFDGELIEDSPYPDLTDLGVNPESDEQSLLKYKLVTFDQQKVDYGDGLDQFLLFLTNPEFPSCRILIISSTLQQTSSIDS